MPLPLILAALAGGKALYGAVSANNQKQRNKGYIQQSYDTAEARLNAEQAHVRAGTGESLAARGLSPIQSAMAGGAAPHTLGAQVQADTEKQLGLEQTDLEQQRQRAATENTANYANALIGAGVGAAQGMAGAYTAGQDLSAMRTMSPIQSAMTGIDDPANHFGGIVSHDPLNAPGSSWNRGGGDQVNGAGLTNDDFHVE